MTLIGNGEPDARPALIVLHTRSLNCTRVFVDVAQVSGLISEQHTADERYAMPNSPKLRLAAIQRSLLPPPPTVGKLKLGGIEYDVPASSTPSRLPRLRSSDLLDLNNSFNQDNLHFLLQKYLLGQDVFLVSQPGPYARRLAMSFCR